MEKKKRIINKIGNVYCIPLGEGYGMISLF